MATGNAQKSANGSARDFEAQLWAATDNMGRCIRSTGASVGPRSPGSFRADLHSSLKADFIFADPPLNVSDWGGENLRQDVRWKFGMPPVNNANYGLIKHFNHHLSPVGVAGFAFPCQYGHRRGSQIPLYFRN